MNTFVWSVNSGSAYLWIQFFLILTFACILNILPCCLFAFCQRSRSFFDCPQLFSESECKGTTFFRITKTFRTFFSKKLNFFSWPLPHSLFILGAREDFNQNNPFKALLRVFKLTLFWHSLKGKKTTFYGGFNIFSHLKRKKKLKSWRIWNKKWDGLRYPKCYIHHSCETFLPFFRRSGASVDNTIAHRQDA